MQKDATGGGRIKEISGKFSQYYYLGSLLLLACILGYGIHFYWSKGPVNIENINNIFNASSKVDQIKSNNGFEDVLRYVKKYRIRSAIRLIEKLDTETKKIGNDFDLDSYTLFRKDLTKIKNQLQKLLTYPNINSVFTVLLNKTSNFEHFVVSRNWRTLTRISKRLKTKISIGKTTISSNKRIKRLIFSVKKDVELMRKLTKGSVLSSIDKNIIILKLSALSVEVNMLEKYLLVISRFNKNFLTINQSYNKWIGELGPYISLKKIEFERNSQGFLFALIIFLSLIFVLMVFGYLIGKFSEKHDKGRVEDLILKVVKETLLPITIEGKYPLSSKTYNELEKFREYLHKRMSFGSIFQDAMPFASILLDSNLNLVWGNALFYENWGLGDVNKADEFITWDYIQQYTNLGVSDPMVSALEEQIAGIYQIQVRTKKNSESLPYEMYVSPVTYADQKRVMIIFYPLRSMEETLIHQTQSLVGPISRTLEALSLGNFDDEFKEKICKDFQVANIEEIFTKFEVLDRLQNDDKKSYIDNIQNLEDRNFDFQKTIDDINLIYDEERDLHNLACARFNDAKNSIVDIVKMRQSLEELFSYVAGLSDNILHEESKTLSRLREAYDELDKQSESIMMIYDLRENLKQVKDSLDHVRGRIVSGISSVRSKRHNDQTLNKLQEDFSEFERYMRTFSKVVISIDVNLSKTENDIITSDKESFEYSCHQFSENKKELDYKVIEGQEIIALANIKDQAMVESLSGLYTSFEESRKKSLEVNPLLS